RTCALDRILHGRVDLLVDGVVARPSGCHWKPPSAVLQLQPAAGHVNRAAAWIAAGWPAIGRPPRYGAAVAPPRADQSRSTGSSRRKVPASASISTCAPTGTMNCSRM